VGVPQLYEENVFVLPVSSFVLVFVFCVPQVYAETQVNPNLSREPCNV